MTRHLQSINIENIELEHYVVMFYFCKRHNFELYLSNPALSLSRYFGNLFGLFKLKMINNVKLISAYMSYVYNFLKKAMKNIRISQALTM